jgi:hypothetical protein
VDHEFVVDMRTFGNFVGVGNSEQEVFELAPRVARWYFL